MKASSLTCWEKPSTPTIIYLVNIFIIFVQKTFLRFSPCLWDLIYLFIFKMFTSQRKVLNAFCYSQCCQQWKIQKNVWKKTDCSSNSTLYCRILPLTWVDSNGLAYITPSRGNVMLFNVEARTRNNINFEYRIIWKMTLRPDLHTYYLGYSNIVVARLIVRCIRLGTEAITKSRGFAKWPIVHGSFRLGY